MSQSNTNCPECGRKPGFRHGRTCPRGITAVRKIQALARSNRKRLLWTKGPMTVRIRKWAPMRDLWNPGVPFVKPPKDWYAGGFPGRCDPNGKLPGPVQTFMEQMAIIVKDAQNGP